MNGAQHYREAQIILSCAASQECPNPDREIARAQVHATLAAAAASVGAWLGEFIELEDDANAWAAATGDGRK